MTGKFVWMLEEAVMAYSGVQFRETLAGIAALNCHNGNPIYPNKWKGK